MGAEEVGRLLAISGEGRVERPVGVVAGEGEVAADGGVRVIDREDIGASDCDYLAVGLDRDPVAASTSAMSVRSMPSPEKPVSSAPLVL